MRLRARSYSVVNLLTAQGAGYVLAGVLLRALAGRGPGLLAEPSAAAHVLLSGVNCQG